MRSPSLRSPRRLLPALLVAAAVASGAPAADAQVAPAIPTTPARPEPWAQAVARVPTLALPAFDAKRAQREDEERVRSGAVPHYAESLAVTADPWSHGDWDTVGRSVARWRLRVRSPGALSLNLAFRRFALPDGAVLRLVSADGRLRLGPWTPADADAHGQLWTPPLSGDDLVVEVTLPLDRLDDLRLELASVQHGYAGFGDTEARSGPCNLDVACPDAEPWRDAARAVGLVSVAGVRFCTGFLVNNTAFDGTPYFVTARHCGVTKENAASVVVVWSHESPSCRDAEKAAPLPRRAFRHFQSGATLRASVAATDTVLLELDDAPPAAAQTFFAGWDRADLEPRGAAVVHHPNTDWKRIAVDLDRARVTRHLDPRSDAAGAHLRIGDWELGTTEGGSSGAPLFNRAKRVVGLLHGGYAACGNEAADWFGRFADAWEGEGTPATRLRDWLDPTASGALALDGLDATALPGVDLRAAR